MSERHRPFLFECEFEEGDTVYHKGDEEARRLVVLGIRKRGAVAYDLRLPDLSEAVFYEWELSLEPVPDTA